MSAGTHFSKDPDADLDYAADWTAWLLEDDTIETSEWIVPTVVDEDDAPLPDALVGHDETNTDTTATIWLSGGILGTAYDVINRITTAQGRTEDQTLHFNIRQH